MAQRLSTSGKTPAFGDVEKGILIAAPAALIGVGALIYILTRPSKKRRPSSSYNQGSEPSPV